MPSWSIHTALTEKLLAKSSPDLLGIRDANAFLLGNLLPDLYVGYMVGDASHTLRYIDTHFADSTHIPVPRSDEYWETYVAPLQNSGGADELTRGVWVHLLADKRYNERVRAFNAKHHIENNEITRVKKQHDFALFGHVLAPTTNLVVNNMLLKQADRFAQYEVLERDVHAAARAHIKHLRKTAQPPKNTDFQLLTPQFIRETFDEIIKEASMQLTAYEAGVSVSEAVPHNERPKYPVGPEPAILLKNDPEAAAAYRTKNVH